MIIPSAQQVRILDEITIQKKYNASMQLMEHAAGVFVKWFKDEYPDTERTVHIFCGPGNNGGDGFIIAKLMHYEFYNIKIYRCLIGTASKDNDISYKALPERVKNRITILKEQDDLPQIEGDEIIIDAIFGNGINRAVKDYWADLIHQINACKAEIIAVDLPSGLHPEWQEEDACIKADKTLSFEFSKLQFLLPMYAEKVGHWQLRSIGLDREAIEKINCSHHYIAFGNILSPQLRILPGEARLIFT